MFQLGVMIFWFYQSQHLDQYDEFTLHTRNFLLLWFQTSMKYPEKGTFLLT